MVLDFDYPKYELFNLNCVFKPPFKMSMTKFRCVKIWVQLCTYFLKNVSVDVNQVLNQYTEEYEP